MKEFNHINYYKTYVYPRRKSLKEGALPTLIFLDQVSMQLKIILQVILKKRGIFIFTSTATTTTANKCL